MAMAEAAHRPAHRVTWFAPQRPVENGTVFVRPAAVLCVCGHSHEDSETRCLECACVSYQPEPADS